MRHDACFQAISNALFVMSDVDHDADDDEATDKLIRLLMQLEDEGSLSKRRAELWAQVEDLALVRRRVAMRKVETWISENP